jgi:tricorn protease-like protein
LPTPNTENSFSFRQMNTAHLVTVPHFQLRNLMAAPNRENIFYGAGDVVLQTDAQGTRAKTAIDLSKERAEFGKVKITTLAASDEVLIAGGFEGEYALRPLTGVSGQTVGRIKEPSRGPTSYIMNHVHLCTSRTNYAPQAILCSNDKSLSILDCATNTVTHSLEYSEAINCTATSPNGRMRVVVGDMNDIHITNAETGKPFETMKAHADGAFACDWADDGIHVATAAQDSTIVIYDARYWARPLKVMCSELSIPRSLKFSPIGGGPRVLVSAEADDYLNIINAQTFESKQVFDFFGCTAGISMTPDGSSLFMANSDCDFGGIAELERCAWGESRRGRARRKGYEEDSDQDSVRGTVDWDSESALDDDERVIAGREERRRRGIDLGALSI